MTTINLPLFTGSGEDYNIKVLPDGSIEVSPSLSVVEDDDRELDNTITIERMPCPHHPGNFTYKTTYGDKE